MNSYYYFLTVHCGWSIAPEELEKVLKKAFPEADITVSDEEFKNER